MVCLCHSGTVHPSFQTQQWAENQKVSMIEGIDTFWSPPEAKTLFRRPSGAMLKQLYLLQFLSK